MEKGSTFLFYYFLKFPIFYINLNVIYFLSLYPFIFECPIIDILLGTAIALYIIYGAYKLFVNATKRLIDEEFDIQEKQKITDIYFYIKIYLLC